MINAALRSIPLPFESFEVVLMSVGRAGGWVAKCFRVGSHNPLWKIKFYLIFNLSEKYFCLKSSTGASSSKLLDLESQFTALMDERARPISSLCRFFVATPFLRSGLRGRKGEKAEEEEDRLVT